MKVATITWDQFTDKTKIVFSDEFIQENPTLYADVLSDVLSMVQEMYDASVKSLFDPQKQPLQKETTI